MKKKLKAEVSIRNLEVYKGVAHKNVLHFVTLT